MPLFRTHWTAHEADEWTKEDFWACVFSSLSYVFLMIGLALCFLFPWWGILDHRDRRGLRLADVRRRLTQSSVKFLRITRSNKRST